MQSVVAGVGGGECLEWRLARSHPSSYTHMMNSIVLVQSLDV